MYICHKLNSTMKSFLLTTLLFISQLLLSQPTISRAYAFCYGTRENIGEKFTWSENYESNFLIVSQDQSLTIHANRKFQYYTLEDLGENAEGDSHKFLMLDQDGKKCHLFISHYENIVFIIVEYSDTAIMYFTKSADQN